MAAPSSLSPTGGDPEAAGPDHDHDHHHHHHVRGPSWGPIVVVAPIAIALLARNRVGWFTNDDVRLWSTLFVSIAVQALPFLVLGVVLSGLIAAFVSPDLVERIVPRRPIFAVPTAGVAGLALPGCECGSVPIAGRLISAGTPPAAALTFLLAAPAINPVVLVSTAVAFPADQEIVVARFAASFIVAVAIGWWWARRGTDDLLSVEPHDHSEPGKWAQFSDTASRDLVHAGGYLVVGAAAAATLQLVIPRSALDAVGGSEVASVLVLAALAVLLSICSEADAFVAAGLPQFSLTSRLVFLVVGPVIDLKLIAMQSGVFGRRFAMVFAPVTFVTAIVSAVVVGQVVL